MAPFVLHYLCPILFVFVVPWGITVRCENVTNVFGDSVVVLAVPSIWDSFYHEKLNDVIEFQIKFANSIIGKENVVMIADRFTVPYLNGSHPDQITVSVPNDIIVESNLYDIWLRDLAPVSTKKQHKFIFPGFRWMDPYASRQISMSFNRFLKDQHLVFGKTNLMLSGRDFVDNGNDIAILNNRVMEQFSDALPAWHMASIMKHSLGYENVTLWTPQVQNVTQSSPLPNFLDETCIFVNVSTLFMTTMQQPYKSGFRKALINGSKIMDDFKIVELGSPMNPGSWKNLRGTCGSYLGLLITDDYVYTPVFGGDSENQKTGHSKIADFAAITLLDSHCPKQIVPIAVPRTICEMGINPRSVSWALKGRNAQRLIQSARQ